MVLVCWGNEDLVGGEGKGENWIKDGVKSLKIATFKLLDLKNAHRSPPCLIVVLQGKKYNIYHWEAPLQLFSYLQAQIGTIWSVLLPFALFIDIPRPFELYMCKLDTMYRTYNQLFKQGYILPLDPWGMFYDFFYAVMFIY